MILLDSDVLIAHLRGHQAARDWLLSARRDTGPLAVSAITVTEVAGGMRSAEQRQVSRLLASLDTFGVTERVAWRAAEFMRTYRRSHQGIGLGDYLIAATAEVEGLDLATLNVRHYPMVEGLKAPFRL
ncbi:MAG: type II toxin-antitoxin system VapC family toxin [Actinomycetota bacterium]|nr:type II toxin-antitoxin system VapC family toxin [Actinomycetota bacterium]